MISVIDLTERKKAEEELSESEGRFRAVVEQATEGIVRFDVDANAYWKRTSLARTCSVTPPKRYCG
jgi:PAS domain-containing protein